MNPLEYKRAYRRKLPHHQPPGATFFITTRLAGSLPKETWRQLRKQFDDIYRELSNMANHLHLVLMPLPTTDPALKAFANTSLVANEEGDLGYLNTERNFTRLHFYSLASIMHSIKRHSALECNKLLDRTGPFWEVENYDRFARNAREVERMIRYTLNNPVKAGLVEKWDQWKWNWRKDPINTGL